MIILCCFLIGINAAWAVHNIRKTREIFRAIKLLELGAKSSELLREKIKQVYYDTIKSLYDVLDNKINTGQLKEPTLLGSRDKLFSVLVEMEIGDSIKTL